MKNLKNKITSIEDVDNEIEEVKQRIQLQETGLAETLKAVPRQALKMAVSPLTEAVSSTVGSGLLFKSYGVVKNFLDTSKPKTEENKIGTKSITSTLLKNIAMAGLFKLASRFLRRG